MNQLSRGWKLFILISFVAGFFLRTLCVQDMEYKEDEQYNYTQSQTVGTTAPWPDYGIASGVFIVNPGMSVWVFAALAKISGAKTPTELARALQIFSILGISLLIPFALFFVKNPADRIPWLWAFALAMVNPLAILYQRKLWPEPFLPFFSMLFLMGWYRRDHWLWAFVWGIVGASLGQIHMSGFFYAGSLFFWTLFWKPEGAEQLKIKWKSWLIGSFIGAYPLIGWARYVLTHPTPRGVSPGWGEALQFKFWDFWMGDAFGLHLGNTLGIYIGDTQWEQLSDFVRYPLIAGHATYVVGLAHLAILVCAAWAVLKFARWVQDELKSGARQMKRDFVGRESSGTFARNSAFLGTGIMMTLTNVNIRRYYMMVTFPFEQYWLARFASSRNGKWVLATLWLAQLLISANFVHYIHVNLGSPKGDYGDAYHVVMQKRGLGQ